jgi:hypothetical protein
MRVMRIAFKIQADKPEGRRDIDGRILLKRIVGK